MEWYIKKGVPLNLGHLLIRARNSGDWEKETITKEDFTQLLQDKIARISFNNVRDDIMRFIKDDKVLDIWSAGYFNDLIKKIKLVE